MRALGYCRVSSLEQATGTSLRDQQAATPAPHWGSRELY